MPFIFQTGAGTPVGNVVPNALRSFYQDTDTGDIWVATGLTNADWQRQTDPAAIGGGGGGGGSKQYTLLSGDYTLQQTDDAKAFAQDNSTPAFPPPTVTIPAGLTVPYEVEFANLRQTDINDVTLAFAAGNIVFHYNDGGGGVSADGPTFTLPGAVKGAVVKLRLVAAGQWVVLWHQGLQSPVPPPTIDGWGETGLGFSGEPYALSLSEMSSQNISLHNDAGDTIDLTIVDSFTLDGQTFDPTVDLPFSTMGGEVTVQSFFTTFNSNDTLEITGNSDTGGMTFALVATLGPDTWTTNIEVVSGGGGFTNDYAALIPLLPLRTSFYSSFKPDVSNGFAVAWWTRSSTTPHANVGLDAPVMMGTWNPSGFAGFPPGDSLAWQIDFYWDGADMDHGFRFRFSGDGSTVDYEATLSPSAFATLTGFGSGPLQVTSYFHCAFAFVPGILPGSSQMRFFINGTSFDLGMDLVVVTDNGFSAGIAAPGDVNFRIGNEWDGSMAAAATRQLQSQVIDEVAFWDSTNLPSDYDMWAAAVYNGGLAHDLTTLGEQPSHWWRMGDQLGGVFDGTQVPDLGTSPSPFDLDYTTIDPDLTSTTGVGTV